MDWTRMMRGARAILDDCASVEPGETVLIVTDTELAEIGRVLAAAAYERGAEPVVAVITPREMDGQEPPDSIAEAMRHADVVLAPVSRSITHTRAVKEAASAGARILVMTAFTEGLMISGGIEADFRAQRPVCERLAELFTEADGGQAHDAGRDRPRNGHRGAKGERTYVCGRQAAHVLPGAEHRGQRLPR